MNGRRFCSGHSQRNFISITGLQKRLRAFLKPFFHAWSRDGKQLFFRSSPFRENGTAERPQTLRCPKIRNNFSAKNAQQRRRPPPVAETGRSCWGSGQQGMSGSEMTAGSRNPCSPAARPSKTTAGKMSAEVLPREAWKAEKEEPLSLASLASSPTEGSPWQTGQA